MPGVEKKKKDKNENEKKMPSDHCELHTCLLRPRAAGTRFENKPVERIAALLLLRRRRRRLGVLLRGAQGVTDSTDSSRLSSVSARPHWRSHGGSLARSFRAPVFEERQCFSHSAPPAATLTASSLLALGFIALFNSWPLSTRSLPLNLARDAML